VTRLCQNRLAMAMVLIGVVVPTRAAAQLEWSKAWAKDFFRRQQIPTARAEVVASEAQARQAVARARLTRRSVKRCWKASVGLLNIRPIPPPVVE